MTAGIFMMESHMPNFTSYDLLADPKTPVFLTDGGLETAMIYDHAIDLPMFASFALLESVRGLDAMTRYFDGFLRIAAREHRGFVLDTATWRSGMHWGAAMGRSAAEMSDLNRRAVDFAKLRRSAWAARIPAIVINDAVGPSGDGYAVGRTLDPATAEARHRPQITTLAEAGVDMISAITMIHPGEAIGIVRAAQSAGKPVVVSFTVETDGCLPNGQTLAEAIAETDWATGRGPAWYMVNCAHPDHFRPALEEGAAWLSRIGGLRSNASRMSHAELDAATALDAGDPQEFGMLHRNLLGLFLALRVLGGCCGTDHRHVGCIAESLAHSTRAA
jgi:homocysteine S-methyltransferase